ncbi:hypothetical protein EYC84_002935 [Monilinia fructicola]|uniref:Zn(2)-C6 fungal-type domain-containing protein n=1 Tax=Monilinia fructicola TaxID=38448 RepID=A0A5M9JUL6_MONFR|nr:hypothetical protein EYC84_002935 [Monilinia fructicola]
MPPPSTQPVIHQKITRGHSCILCQQRKVRCDRQKPQCSNCVKARAECIPSTPAAPRRRRRKLSEMDISARLRKYEHLLRVNGIRLDDDEDGDGDGGGGGGNASGNASGNEDVRLAADQSDPIRQENNPTARVAPSNTHNISNQGKEINTTTGTESNENPNASNKRQHGSHDLHGNHSMGCPRGTRVRRGQLFSKHGNSRYIENTIWENLSNELQDPKEAFQVSSEDEDNNDNPLFPEESTILLGNLISPKRNLRSLHPQPVTIFRLWQIFLTNVNPLIKLFHAPTVQEMILEATSDMDHIPKPTEALMFVIYLLSIGSLKDDECESTFHEPRGLLLSRYSHATQQALINVKYIKSLNLTTLQAYCLFLLAARKHYDAHAFWILTGSAVRIGQRLGIHRDGSSLSLSPFDTEMRRRVWWQIVFLDGFAAKLCGAGYPAWLAKFDTKLPLNVSDSDLTPDMIEPPPERAGATEMLFCCIRYEVSQAIRKANRFGDGHAHDHGGGHRGHHGEPSHIPPGSNVIAEKDKTIDELEARLQDNELRRRERGELVDKAWQQVELAYEFRADMLNDTKNSLYFALGNLVLKAWEKREEGGHSADQITAPRFISILRSQRQKHDQVPRSIERDDLSDPFATVNHWQMPGTAESYVRQKPPDYIPPQPQPQPGLPMQMPIQIPQEQPWLASDSFLDTLYLHARHHSHGLGILANLTRR